VAKEAGSDAQNNTWHRKGSPQMFAECMEKRQFLFGLVPTSANRGVKPGFRPTPYTSARPPPLSSFPILATDTESCCLLDYRGVNSTISKVILNASKWHTGKTTGHLTHVTTPLAQLLFKICPALSSLE
jgi:hypothetical protein